MIYRKLIKFGNSSYVISIPRDWLNKHNLNKGNTVFIEENGNNELVLSAQKDKKKEEQKEAVIDTKNKSIATIKREIMSAYINSYSTIRVMGDLKGIKKDVDDILYDLLALEVMEQTSTKMIIKDFLNIKDISIKEILRRQDIMTRSMLGGLKACLRRDCRDDLTQMDKGINKLRFLLYRVIVKALKDPEVLRIIDIENYSRLLDYWILVSNLEELSDESKRLGRLFVKANLKAKELEELENICGNIELSYLEVMKAFYTKNKEIAHNIASQRDEHLRICDEFFENNSNKYTGAMAEKLKHMEARIRNIARVVIDIEPKNEII